MRQRDLDDFEERFRGFVILAVVVIIIALCWAVDSNGQGIPPEGRTTNPLVYDPPGGCHTPTGDARPCEWYERSYLLPKAQQEQLLPVLLERVLGGNLGINTDPAPRVIDDTARVAAMADDTEDMISVADAAVMLHVTRSRVHKIAGDMGLPLRLAKRGRNHVVVFTPAEVERMAARNKKRGPRR